MTIQSYEIRALDDFGGRIHWIPSDLGAWCPADSVRRLEADMETLKAELAALKAPIKKLSAEEVTEPGWYWWKKIGADDFNEPVQVFEDEHYITHDPILILSRIGCVGAISQECWQGQFIGPIQMPEV